METRLIVAYALIALLLLASAGLTVHFWYNERNRKIGRQRDRERRSRSQS